MTFVCTKCREGKHDQCPGGTWCDCGHRQPQRLFTPDRLAVTTHPIPMRQAPSYPFASTSLFSSGLIVTTRHLSPTRLNSNRFDESPHIPPHQ